MHTKRFKSFLGIVVLSVSFNVLSAFMENLHAMSLSDLGSYRWSDWSRAGYPGNIPDIDTNVINVKENGASGDGVTDDYSAIQSIINNAPNPSVIYFPAGVYHLKSKFTLKSGIVLRGAGSNITRLDFESDSGCISFSGSTGGSYTAITSGLNKGSNQLSVADASKFRVGQGGEIRQKDIDAVDPTGEWAHSGWVPTYVVGQMVKITSINGNTLTIDPPLNLAFSVDKNPEILPVNFVSGVGIEDLHIRRLDTGASSNNITISRAADCWIRRVESDYSLQYHISITKSLHLEIRDSYIHDCVSKGDGGAGYGVSLATYDTAILVENCIFNELRHSMIIQVGVNGCVFGYNYAQRNYSDDGWDKSYISVHGHYPFMNLFEGNVVGWAYISDYWGASGPGNTLFRNRVIGTDKHMEFGPYRGIAVDDYSHSQNIIGNELTGSSTAITFDGKTDSSQATSNDLIVHGNNVHGTINWDPSFSDHNLPASFYLSSKPAFFGTTKWPAFGPDMTLGSGTIPAKDRWASGEYIPQPDQTNGKPSAPKNLRKVSN